jgi:hypothetical protein
MRVYALLGHIGFHQLVGWLDEFHVSGGDNVPPGLLLHPCSEP